MNSQSKTSLSNSAHPAPNSDVIDFIEHVRVNQKKLAKELKPRYDFIVCGSGSSGSVVARRLAENPAVSVLLLEAGGSDDVPSVMEANQRPLNLGSERNWGFSGSRNSHLNGRTMPLPMGKVLGGGSSINLMVWSHGHKKDWDFFADEAANHLFALTFGLINNRSLFGIRTVSDDDIRQLVTGGVGAFVRAYRPSA